MRVQSTRIFKLFLKFENTHSVAKRLFRHAGGGLYIRPCRPAQPPGPGYYATGVGRIYNPPLREGRERVRRGGLHGRPDRTDGLPQTCLLRTRPVGADAHIGPPGPNHNAPRPWRHVGMPPWPGAGVGRAMRAPAVGASIGLRQESATASGRA